MRLLLFFMARRSWRFRTSCVLRTFANAALLLFFGVGPAAAEVSSRPLVEFRGNVLFDELVYRSVLELPESASATAADALAASAKLRSFLLRAGYDLATVRGKVVGEQIVLDIDEGRLDKIIVLGEGLVETLRFRMDLSMPAGVFNRPALERQLRVLGERYRLRHYSYELVPAAVSLSLKGSGLRPMRVPPGIARDPAWAALPIAHPRRLQPLVARLRTRGFDQLARGIGRRGAVPRAGLLGARRSLGPGRPGRGRDAAASRLARVTAGVHPRVDPGPLVLAAGVHRVAAPRADCARRPPLPAPR